MTLRASAARGLKWQVLEIAGRQALSLAVFTALARLLDPTDFGLVGVVWVYLTFLILFVDQGIGTALVQRKNLEPRHLDTAFWFSVASGVAVVVGTIALAGVLGEVVGDPRVVPLLRWASMSVLLTAAGSVPAAMLVKALNFRPLMLRTIGGNLVGGSIAIAMALEGYGVWALIGQQLAVSATSAGILWWLSPWRPSLNFSVRHLRDLTAVSGSVFVASLLWVFSSRVDQLVIGRFAGVAALGQYVIGVRLAELAKAAVQDPIATVSMPTFAAVQNDYARLRHALYSAMELNAVICFAVFGGLAAVAPTVVPLAFGQQWTAAGSILQLIAIYNLVVSLSVFSHPALLASGGIRGYVAVSVFCAVGAAASSLIGVRTGVHLVVILLTGNISVTAVFALMFLRRRIALSLRRFCRPAAVPALAAVLMFAVVTGTRMALTPNLPLWGRAVAEIAIGAIVYLSIVRALAPGSLARLWQMVVHALARTEASPVSTELKVPT